MQLTLLREKHSIRQGDSVVIVERTNAEKKYHGKVYKIVNLPLNKHLPQPYYSQHVDYFYITFSEEIQNDLLKKGLPIIYNHSDATLGNIIRNDAGQIEKIYMQRHHFDVEIEINLNHINAILMWRVAYDIKPLNVQL